MTFIEALLNRLRLRVAKLQIVDCRHDNSIISAEAL